MANCKLPPKEFIRNSFLPQVAVICSQTANLTCQKNNLSFTELLQPFCKLGTEVQYKDGAGAVISLKNFKISLIDVNSSPPPPALARKLLNLSVSEASEPRLQTLTLQNYTIDVPASTSWFDSWRDTFLQVQFPSDHEFTKHYLSCMFVVSSAEKDPLQTFAQLVQCVAQMHNASPMKMPKWFSKDTLFYYILLHENLTGNHVFAVDCFDKMKAAFGNYNCFLLRMNSRTPGKVEQLPDPWCRFIKRRVQVVNQESVSETSPSTIRTILDAADVNKLTSEGGNSLEYHPLSPDHKSDEDASIKDVLEKPKSILHGVYLTTEDVEQIKLLIHEFCTRALIPYVERQINFMADFVTNKKGVSRSLLSATKRWFSSKPGSIASNTLLYSPDSPELQTRRLGDLCFMFGNYHLAYDAYHSAKRDYIADQAWLYYAGALEMASLAAFMGNGSNRKTGDYMEESITTYLTTCKMPQFATRATLLSSECLKSQQYYGEAAHQLIRMTSEESDLRSAVLLEQAAYCFLYNKPCMIRKYAFHMVLAGHRYSKASQRRHSLRCYKQAFQIYKDKGWNLSEDHIHYTIGRQANNLNHLEEAVESYSKLLTGRSKQCADQQVIFLKDYLSTYSSLLREQNVFIAQVLPLPILRTKSTKILLGLSTPLRSPGRVAAVDVNIDTKEDAVRSQKWHKLEEMLVQEAQGSLPMIFKPLKTFLELSAISNVNPVAIVGEPIHVILQLENKFLTELNLKDIYLLWHYTDGKNRSASNEITGSDTEWCVKSASISAITLNPSATQEINLSIIPVIVGEIVLKGICYCLLSPSSGADEVAVKGKQTFEVDTKGNDRNEKQFKISVVPEAPCLQVTFSELDKELLRNELQKIYVEITNVGSESLHHAYLATSKPQLISSCEFRQKQNSIDAIESESLGTKEKSARKNHVARLPLSNGVLEPGQNYSFNIWLKAPNIVGPTSIDLLIYYENVKPNSNPKYRLIRHEWHLQIEESIKVDVRADRSVKPEGSHSLILSTRIMNLNNLAKTILITPINVALISKNWSLNNDVIISEKIKIASQESVNVLLKANKITSDKSEYSQVFFDTTKFLDCFETALLDFSLRDERNNLNVFDDIENCNLSNKTSEAILILRWHAVITDAKGNKRTLYGQNKIPLKVTDKELSINKIQKVPLQESRFDFETQKSLKKDALRPLRNQVKYNIEHPSLIKNDFGKNGIYFIPIKLFLYSLVELYSHVTVKTVIAQSASVLPTRSAMFHSNPSSKFCWIVNKNVQITLSPFGMETVDLTLAVTSPGTYDLDAHLEVWCCNENQAETAIKQLCRNTSALVVINKSC